MMKCHSKQKFFLANKGRGSTMPFTEVDIKQEQKEFEELLKSPVAQKAYEEFEREYEFRQKLAEVRKANKTTQQEI